MPINKQQLFYAFSFTVFLQTLRLHYDLVIHVFKIPKRDYYLEFRYLTVWCMMLQFIYYACRFFTSFSQKKNSFSAVLDYLRTVILFPVGFFVTIVFWGLFAINPYLLMSKEKLEMTNWNIQHLLHTAPLVIQFLESLFLNVPSRFNKNKILKGQVLFQILFTLNLFYFRSVTGKFPYPVLDVIWKKNVVYFFFACSICFLPFQGLTKLCQKLKF